MRYHSSYYMSELLRLCKIALAPAQCLLDALLLAQIKGEANALVATFFEKPPGE